MTRTPLIAARAPMGLSLPAPDRRGRRMTVELIEASDVDRLSLMVEARVVEVQIGNAYRWYPLEIFEYVDATGPSPDVSAPRPGAGTPAQSQRRR